MNDVLLVKSYSSLFKKNPDLNFPRYHILTLGQCRTSCCATFQLRTSTQVTLEMLLYADHFRDVTLRTLTVAVTVQVRRMTGVLVAAGRHIISIDDVRRMVAEPDNESIHEHDDQHDVYIVPSHGLYLASVEYDDKGLWAAFVSGDFITGFCILTIN